MRKSLCFFSNFSPKQIVFSWNSSCQFGYNSLQYSPIIERFKNRIHPSIDNTVWWIKISLMMDMMLLMTNHQPCLLKKLDHFVRFLTSHMSPFVTLVSHNSYNHSKYNSPVECLRKESSTWCPQTSHNPNRHWIWWSSIGFNKVMKSYVLRVNVMLSECSNQSWSENRSSESTPSITSPVNHTWYPID